MTQSTIAPPATLAELQALLEAAGAELPRRREQFLLLIADRAPGYERLARVRVVLTPDLVRQILALNRAAAREAFRGGAGPIEFGGPAGSDAERRQRVDDLGTVTRLARIIVEERWDLAHAAPAEALAFTPALLVVQGRHRLAAVDLADLPITVDVAALPTGLA